MSPPTLQDYKERILRVLVHVQNHLDDALSLEELARVACFSPYHFHRIFRGMVGESVMEHVRRLRLERAAHHLKTTNQPITRVAFAAGYETHEAFTRAFGAMFGDPPSRFREIHRAIPVRKVPSDVHFVDDGSLDNFTPSDTGGSTMDVRIEYMEPMRVAFMRHVGPYNEVGGTWGSLCAWAGPKGLLGPNVTCLGMGHDDPEITPPDKIRYDACITVGPEVQPEGDIGIQETAAGEYAITTHVGPYEKLAETYARLYGEWMPNNGREPATGPCLEIYRNSPQDTPPEKLITDIYAPLKPQ